MRRWKTSSYFMNLLLISCIIGILPVLLLGYLSFHRSADIVEDEVTGGNRLILQQNKQQVEAHLKTIDTLATQMIGGPVTTAAVSMPTVLDLPYAYEYENKKLFDSLIYKLVQIQVYELGVHDVHLISYRQNWIVEGGVVYPMAGRQAENAQDEYLLRLQQQLTDARDDNRRSYWRLLDDPIRGQVLQLIKHIPLNSPDPYGLVAVNVPMAEVGKRLTGGGQLGAVMVLDGSGSILSHLDPERIGDNESGQPYYAELLSRQEPEGLFSREIGGEKYAVIYNRSRYNDWTYVSLTPLDRLMEKSRNIQGYTAIAVAVLIGLVVVASVAASHRMYTPIQRIYRNMKPDARSSGGNELQYIGEQVQRMAQSQTELTDQVQRLNRQAREFYTFKLLVGGIRADELEEHLEKYGYPIDWEMWCLIALQIDTLEDTQYAEKDRELLLYAIHNIAEEVVPLAMRLSPVIQGSCVMLFVGAPADGEIPFKVTVYQYAETIRDSVRTYLKLKVSAGISRSYGDFVQAPQAYEECLDALAYRTRLGQESILFIEEAQPETSQSFRYPRELEFRLLEAVRQLDKEQAIETLSQVVERFYEHSGSHADYQTFLGRLFHSLTGLVQDAGASVQDVFPTEMFASEIMQRMHPPAHIRQWFDTRVLTPLLAWLEERLQKQGVNISQAIIEEIERSYDQDLGIELFAARLNYHPSYISRVFKKDTGVNFTEYLSRYRIEIAKKWLTETDMKVSEIAERLRYSTASNFNRIFKKTVQVTPSQYREQHR